jgi:ABC-type cobalamin/Fe3+-siderophores transport system ATPase subunit
VPCNLFPIRPPYNRGVLEVAGVSLSRGGLALLDGFSLRLPDPGLYLICGAAGSGKSLLARLLAGRQRPDKGQVILDGTPLYRPRGFIPGVRSLLRPQQGAVPLFHAQAGPPLLGDERLYEYIDLELWRAGAPTTTLLPFWEILERAIPRARQRTLGSLALSELSLAQFALGAAIPARAVVLDGQLATLDAAYFGYAQRLLALNLAADRFMVLTAPLHVGELGKATRIELAGGLPVAVTGKGATEA